MRQSECFLVGLLAVSAVIAFFAGLAWLGRRWPFITYAWCVLCGTYFTWTVGRTICLIWGVEK